MKTSSRTQVRDDHSPANLDLRGAVMGYPGRTILRDVTLTIPAGDQVAVVGPNGAGKSTLFKTLAGVLPLQGGEALIHCQPVGTFKGCIAYVPQRSEADTHFPVTVQDVVSMGRFTKQGLFARQDTQDRAAVEYSLEQMGIADLAGRQLTDLSGGQLQRVYLARALAQQPHLLLLDEPFNGVDAATEEATLELLQSLNDQGITIMVSTHDLNLASEKFRNVMLLNGKLISYGPPESALSTENLREAFGGQLFSSGGMLVVDHCCPTHNGNGGAR